MGKEMLMHKLFTFVMCFCSQGFVSVEGRRGKVPKALVVHLQKLDSL